MSFIFLIPQNAKHLVQVNLQVLDWQIIVDRLFLANRVFVAQVEKKKERRKGCYVQKCILVTVTVSIKSASSLISFRLSLLI